tara:strand:- start:189 stop:743 length:555 start_codon:yes stop_codon:yes gene_type:complete
MLAGNDAYFPEFESDDFLEEVVLTTSASSVTFSGLASYATAGYKHLQIRMAAGCAAGFDSSGYLELNGDSTASYSHHRLQGSGSIVSAAGGSSDTYILIQAMLSSNAYPNEFAAGVFDFLDFSSSSKNTTIRALHGHKGTGSQKVSLSSGAYLNTDAITSLTVGGAGGNSMRAGSRFSLYGSKA